MKKDMYSAPSLAPSQTPDPVETSADLQALAFRHAAIGMAMLDEAGSWLDVNEEFCRLLGYSRPEMLKLGYQDLTVAEDIPGSEQAVRQLLSGKCDKVNLDKRYLHRSGASIWVRMRASIVRNHPGVGTVMITQVRDISEERATREALRLSRYRLDLALAGAELGMWHWRLNSGRVQFDDRAVELLGYRSADVDGRLASIIDLCHPEDRPSLRTQFQRHLKGEVGGLDLVVRFRRQVGAYLWLLLRGRIVERKPDGSPLQLSGTLMNVSKWKELEQRLTRLATTDELTGLLNRRAGEAALDSEIKLSRRRGAALSMLLLDIDQFKQINDSLGHDVGDQVLAAVGRHLRDATRAGDCAIRWGGEEFAVLLPGTDQSGACEQAAQLMAGMTRLGEDIEAVDRLSASAGIVSLRPQESARELMKRADALMYRAKAAGRGRMECDLHTCRVNKEATNPASLS
ncbi:MAG: diguanylate cyclase [Wenzhouxiangella sp.]|nr:diguanylate cyclase [Wenzhouxiangella sp.]